jgi:HD-like signal output (HDOD) protein
MAFTMSMFTDFDSIISNMGELPPSPIVATKLLDLLKKPDLRIRELANAVSLDPVISARLLRMANSVVYQQVKQVGTVDRALIVVGEDVLKNLALECSLRGTQKTYGLLERKLWENSIGCAVACRMLARKLTRLEPGEAYLVGLQHNIGKVVMVNRDKERYREVVRIVEAGDGQLCDVERGLFAYSHELVGAALLDHWNYPKFLVQVALHHHDFETSAEPDRKIFEHCALVALAQDFCRRFGIGCSAEQDIIPSLGRGALLLEANPMIVDELVELFYSEFIRERNLFLS